MAGTMTLPPPSQAPNIDAEETQKKMKAFLSSIDINSIKTQKPQVFFVIATF